MERHYQYRRHLREPAKYFLFLYLMFIILYIAMTAIALQELPKEDFLINLAIFAGIGLFLSITFWLAFLPSYFLILKRFKKIGVSLTDEGIVYRNIAGQTVIPYGEIDSLKFPYLRYLGGWVKIIHARGSIRLTVVLESIGDFIRHLKEELDQMDMQHTYKEKKLFNFYKTAVYSDQSWARIYDYCKGIVLFILANVLAALVLLQFDKSGNMAFPLLISAFCLPWFCFIISEAIIGRKVAAETKKTDFSAPERNTAFEKQVYKWVYGVYSVFYLVFALYALVA